MSTRVDVEETPSERLLADVLAVFLLIGGIWVYAKLDDAARSTTPPDYSFRGTPAEQVAVARLNSAQQRLEREDEGRCDRRRRVGSAFCGACGAA